MTDSPEPASVDHGDPEPPSAEQVLAPAVERDLVALASQPGFAMVRFGLVGTAVFVIAMAVAVPLRNDRAGQAVAVVASMALFAAGVATTLWAYTSALERSRTAEVGVSNLYLLTGPTAPRPVRRALWGCLATQIVVAVVAASIGFAGLDEHQLNALAFAVLVPMFGIGTNGIWAARHGWYGPRGRPTVQPENRKMG
jgi:hypothetical protein